MAIFIYLYGEYGRNFIRPPREETIAFGGLILITITLPQYIIRSSLSKLDYWRVFFVGAIAQVTAFVGLLILVYIFHNDLIGLEGFLIVTGSGLVSSLFSALIVHYFVKNRDVDSTEILDDFME